MPKVFIITEQELSVVNSTKQAETLDLLANLSANNPTFSVATLIELARQHLDGNVSDIVEVAGAGVEINLDTDQPAGFGNVETNDFGDSTNDDDKFDFAEDERIAEEYIDVAEDVPDLEEDGLKEDTTEDFEEFADASYGNEEEKEVRSSSLALVDAPSTTVEEPAQEAEVETYIPEYDEESEEVRARREAWRGLFSEAGKLDRLS